SPGRIYHATAAAVGGGNVVSGNNQYGIWIDGAASTGNQVRKNYVGTTANGLSALGNFNCGLLIGSADNVIGGMQAELGNIISGNVEYGLFINGPNAAGNQVQRNAIGVNANGAALGNGFDGVTLISCTGNTIGGAGTANVIAYNGRNGVTVASNGNTANAILNNALFANGALGIDLAPLDGAGNLDFGVTLNDPADGDSGPNSLRNFPVLSAAVVSTVGGNTMLRVQGVLNTGVSSTNTVQLYLNPACDPSGNGEGQTYLGQFTVTIPAGNVANFDQSLALPAGVGITPGAVVTATTSLTVFGVSTGTSEFSPCLPVQTPTLAVNDISVTEGNSGTTNATFTVTLNNAQGAPGPITVNYATADNTATAPGDYTALSGTLTFNAPFAQNTITQTITVPVVGDTTVEPDETFFLNLTAGSGAALADGQGQATIVNDDTACPTITLNPATLPGGSVGVFYSQTLAAAGGNAPYNFAVTSGGLPNGTALTAGGALTGTPALPGTFGFTVTATDSNGCTGARAYTVVIAGTGGSGLQFFPLAQPVRLLETRAGFSGCTVPGLPISAGGTLTISTQGSCTNIPGNAQAVTGNITVVPSGAGFLTLFPSSASQPTVANSNFAAGEVTNNVFTVGLGSGDGAFKIFANATTHVIVDVTGYYAPPPVSGPGGLYFHPLPAPVRLLETRAGLNGCVAPGAPLIGTGNPNADPNQDFAVQGRSPIASPCNSIPASAQMLVGNATTVVPGGGGYLTIYPSGGTRPLIASSNYSGNDIINGPFAVKLGADGKFKIYTLTTTHLVIDVLGYYSEEAVDANGAGLLFNPLPAPVRLLETRPGGLPLVGCTRTNAPIQGNLNAATHTQPARDFCGLPASAQAVVGNASVVNTARAGFLTLFPGNLMTPPLVATSNYPAPAAAGYNRHYFVGLSPTDGTFKVLTQATTELILDASGYFAP
ncbi:MAG TPA: Calx-beta domain-containing protein, partial [Blastocatellia bacterium]|nr:Calx-beta domain-containing protein [Blastocatellia bacterium]